MDWIARSLELIKRHGGGVPDELFTGRWVERHPLNVPGRFYGAATDTCCDGPGLAPASLLYDHEGCGFVWRQPRNESELAAFLQGANSDPFHGYGDDGDDHWSPELVRAWWAERDGRRPLVEALVRDLTGPLPDLPTDDAVLMFRCLPVGGYTKEERAAMKRIVGDYVAYLNEGLADDLRRYIAFLETGSHPKPNTALPAL